MFKNILVPLDGSPAAESALSVARDEAKAHGAAIVLIQVVRPPESVVAALSASDPTGMAPDFSAIRDVVDDEVAVARAYVDRLAEQLKGAGLVATSKVLVGFPSGRIREYAKENGVDLIVMATHGRGGLIRWYMGSIASDVVRKATVPVLLVRAQQKG